MNQNNLNLLSDAVEDLSSEVPLLSLFFQTKIFISIENNGKTEIIDAADENRLTIMKFDDPWFFSSFISLLNDFSKLPKND